MKKLVLCTLSLFLVIAISHDLQAQPWKKLKEKAKEVTKGVKKVDKKTETTTATNQNTDANNQATNNSNQVTDSKADPEFKKWFDEKFSLIYGLNDYNFNVCNQLYIVADVNNAIEGARKLDYVNTMKKIDGKKEIAEATIPWNQLTRMKEFGKKFEEEFRVNHKKFIYKKIEDAYKNKIESEYNSVQYMVEAYGVMELDEIIMPDDPEVKELRKETDKAYEDILKPYYSKVYTSDFHKQNKGKILFSKKPIDHNKIDPAQFTDEFTANDNIYAIVYLDGTIRQLSKNDADGFYRLEIDKSTSNTTQFIKFGHNDEDLDKAWYSIEIIPSKENAIHSVDPVEFGKIFSGLSPKKHTITLVFGAGYSKDMVSGDFTIDLTGMDPAKMKQNGEEASKNAQINWDKKRQLPDYVKNGAQNKFTSPELSEANMKKAIIERYATEGALQVTKIYQYKKELPEDWYVSKNAFGIITDKTSRGVVLAVYKAKDGWCYYVPYIKFKKVYLNGKYGRLEVFIPGSPTRLDCKNCQ